MIDANDEAMEILKKLEEMQDVDDDDDEKDEKDERPIYITKEEIESYIITEKYVDPDKKSDGITTKGIENVTFKNTIFREEVLKDVMYFKNCTFNNCAFTKLKVNSLIFTGCHFDDFVLFNFFNIDSIGFSSCTFDIVHMVCLNIDAVYIKDSEFNKTLCVEENKIKDFLFDDSTFKTFILNRNVINKLCFANCEIEQGYEFNFYNYNRIDDIKTFYCNFDIKKLVDPKKSNTGSRITVAIPKKVIELIQQLKMENELPVDFDPEYSYPGGEYIGDIPDEVLDGAYDDNDDEDFENIFDDIDKDDDEDEYDNIKEYENMNNYNFLDELFADLNDFDPNKDYEEEGGYYE